MKTRHGSAAAVFAIVLTTAGLAATARPARAGTVTVKGSDTMVVLGQRWAEEFMRKHPETTVQVTGGGSGTGISALINGTTDVCEASRTMKDIEKKQVADKAGAPPVEIPVAKDGLSVYVHESNPLTEISMADLKAIFMGKVSSWKDVGGPDAKIIPYSRENSSGTYVFFKEHVLENGDFTPRAQNMPGTAAVVNAVSKEKFAIGYGGAAYSKGIKVLKIKKGRGAGGRADRRHHQGRQLSAVAPAVLLHPRQGRARDQDVHGLGPVPGGPGDRREGGIFPPQIALKFPSRGTNVARPARA